MKAELTPLKGGSPIPITRDITLIGRQEDLCDVFIDKSSISKLHCLIVRTDGLLFIRDLGSTNGTKVNGQRVVRGALLPGDELSLASEKFKVTMGPADAVVVQQEAHTEVISVSVPEDRLRLSPETPLPLNQPSRSDVRLLDES
jgi:pSer/pThr/pTyr-binding forkhead associated (FHA) protein